MTVTAPARRALVLALVAAGLVVTARSAVFVMYPQSYFDADQAILGLMAKHWIEGRAFPLFYYGQGYMLAIDAWLLAPVFLIAGPTVTAMHSTTLAVQLLTVGLLIAGLVRWCGLRPFDAWAASLFLTFAGPMTSAWFIANHGNFWPLFYVLIVWIVRDRPLLLGVVLGVGGLHREFTLSSVPLLVCGQLLTGSLFRVRTMRAWCLTAAAFLAVWLAVRLLIPHADLMGPGTKGQPMQGPGNSVMENIRTHTDLQPEQWIARSNWMLRMYFPRQIGARPITESLVTPNPAVFPQGRNWMFWLLMPALGLVGARVLWLTWIARGTARLPAFGWYLVGLGAVDVAVYVMTMGLVKYVIDRYLFLSIYSAVGIVALFFALEPRRWPRVVMYVVLGAWTAVSAADHARVAARFLRGEPDEMRLLADGLVARGIRVALAEYSVAYSVSFISRERVKVGSDGLRRISEYEDLARQQGAALYYLRAQPCASDQPPIGRWYLCHR